MPADWEGGEALISISTAGEDGGFVSTFECASQQSFFNFYLFLSLLEVKWTFGCGIDDT
jgi:hypothetical protein